MEQYKALIIYDISDDSIRNSFEQQLENNGFEKIGNQSVYGLHLEEYRIKVQMIKAYFRVYCRKHLEENDTVCFFEARINQEQKLIGMLNTDLLRDEIL